MSYYRECPHCHAHLDPGERCDCQAGKQRAQCPYFCHRVNYKGVASIGCGLGERIRLARDYGTPDERDSYYQDYCCDNYKWCLYYKAVAQIAGQMGLGLPVGREVDEDA